MLGLKESEITKVQTGGPDGDLGSSESSSALSLRSSAENCPDEILLSKDKTIAIIDGSGVLHDPLGLDRSELVRLARDRKMIIEFDSSKISKEGYKILVTDQDFTLPSQRLFSSRDQGLILFTDGEVVADGEDFRNRAHLRYKAGRSAELTRRAALTTGHRHVRALWRPSRLCQCLERTQFMGCGGQAGQ